MVGEMSGWQEFSVENFADAFGAAKDEIPLFSKEASKYDFRYRRLDRSERDTAILSVIKRIDDFTKVGEHRHGIWTDSWEETRQRYLKSDGDIDALDPPFMGATAIVRLGGDYAIPSDPAFEHHWFRVYRQWMFKKFLANESGVEQFYEFGCGSGFNLATVGSLFPRLKLMGLDWAQPAVDLVNQVANDHALQLTGRRFDYFNIDREIVIGQNTAVGTYCSLEQTGTRYIGFFDWLMETKPRIVISMEPAIENYDPTILYDDLAIRYMQHRDYLNGYFSAVRNAANKGDVEILHDRRPGFGSFYHEGYSLIVWRPV